MSDETKTPPVTDRKLFDLGLKFFALDHEMQSMKRKTHIALTRGTAEDREVVKKFFALESECARLRERIAQHFTVRVESSTRRKVLDLLDSKPDKTFHRTRIATLLTIDIDDVDQALHKLTGDGFIEKRGKGLYRAMRDDNSDD